jgi:hypothetical protein
VATTEQTTVATASEQTAVAAGATIAAMASNHTATTSAAVTANVAVTASAAGTTMAAVAGLGGLLTTEQSDADDREEDRNSENDNTIHSKSSSHVISQVPKQNFASVVCVLRLPRRRHSRQTRPSCLHALARNRTCCPVSKLYGLRNLQQTQSLGR